MKKLLNFGKLLKVLEYMKITECSSKFYMFVLGGYRNYDEYVFFKKVLEFHR